AAVLLIGTNNFFHKDTPDAVVAGIRACVTALRARLPHTDIILLGLLPRGRSPRDARRSEFPAVNSALASWAAQAGSRFLDAGGAFLNPDGTIKRPLLPDFTHPSEAGYVLLTNALRPYLETALGREVP